MSSQPSLKESQPHQQPSDDSPLTRWEKLRGRMDVGYPSFCSFMDANFHQDEERGPAEVTEEWVYEGLSTRIESLMTEQDIARKAYSDGKSIKIIADAKRILKTDESVIDSLHIWRYFPREGDARIWLTTVIDVLENALS